MIVRKLRLERGWSQEQLAQMSGLNIRTIQRIERGQNAGLESLKSLAAVFEIDLSQLQPELPMHNSTMDNSTTATSTMSHTVNIAQPGISTNDAYAKRKVLVLAFRFLLISVLLFAINLATNPHYLWAVLPTLILTFIVLYKASALLVPGVADKPGVRTDNLSAETVPDPIDLQKERTRFIVKLVRYVLVIAMLFAINLLTNPDKIWAWWPAIGMGFALLFSGVDALIIEPMKTQNKRK